MVFVKEGVVKVLPVPILVPPVAFWNQFIVPVFAFAPKITVPFPHLDPFEVDVIIGVGLIVAITQVR